MNRTIGRRPYVRDAGGELVGRTRLQKVAYLAQLAGFGDDFDFEYRHYGPFSEDLAAGIEIAALLGVWRKIERRADWGDGPRSTAPVADAGNARRSAMCGVHPAAARVGANRIGTGRDCGVPVRGEGIGPGSRAIHGRIPAAGNLKGIGRPAGARGTRL